MDKKRKANQVLLAMILIMGSIYSFANCIADSCIVIDSNSQKIKIGNRIVKPGLKFDDKEEIIWDSQQDAIKVKYSETKKTDNFYARDFQRKGIRSLYEAKRLATKGAFSEGEIVEFDTICYLWDTLCIPVGYNTDSKNNKTFFIRIHQDNQIRKITLSKDRSEYIIPRKVFKNQDDNPCYIDIFEKEGDWEYVVWRNLYVIPLPLSDKSGH